MCTKGIFDSADIPESRPPCLGEFFVDDAPAILDSSRRLLPPRVETAYNANLSHESQPPFSTKLSSSCSFDGRRDWYRFQSHRSEFCGAVCLVDDFAQIRRPDPGSRSCRTNVCYRSRQARIPCRCTRARGKARKENPHLRRRTL